MVKLIPGEREREQEREICMDMDYTEIQGLPV